MPKTFWFGVQSGSYSHYLDDDPTLRTPLQTNMTDKGKSFADGSPYEEGVHFDFGYPLPEPCRGPCLKAKLGQKYVTRDSRCSSVEAFFCKWNGKVS